jgi:hypothetical protein
LTGGRPGVERGLHDLIPAERGHDAWGDGVGSVADGPGDPSGDGDGRGFTEACGVLPSPGVGLACVAFGLGFGVGDGRVVAGAVVGEVVCCTRSWVSAVVDAGLHCR